MMDDIRVPIYLVTGFLESGKTTFLDFTLQQEYFAIDVIPVATKRAVVKLDAKKAKKNMIWIN